MDKLSRGQIEKLLRQGQITFISEKDRYKVYITRNPALQYSANISGKHFNTVFQQYNEFNGLNYWQETGVRSVSFWEDLADWLYEHLY